MRLFLAIPLPPAVTERLGALQAELRRSRFAEDLRFPPPAALHLTLHFLGEVAEEDVAALSELLADQIATHVSGRLRLDCLGCYPERGRVRVIWAGASDPAPLQPLHSATGAVLRSLEFELEQRSFSPHITLARSRRNSRVGDAVRDHLEELWQDELELPVEEVQFVSSVLSRAGARYDVIATFPLSRGDR